MIIEFKTDLLLVKHSCASGPGPADSHIYELWMIPAAAPELRERLHYFTGAQAGAFAECKQAVDQTTAAIMKEGISLPVLWMNRADKIFIVEE